MTVTLQPVLEALGYAEHSQQRALVKLLQASGAFGEVQGVVGILSDQQADAILQNLTFNSPEHAANLLHEITQTHMIFRDKGVERYECVEKPHFEKHRAELLQALRDVGMIDETAPKLKHYDHVLVPGALEGEVNTRFDTLKQLAEQGVSFDKIHMLGSERRLHAEQEASANTIGPNGEPVSTEMGMMESHYYSEKPWPANLEKARIFEVNTYNKPDGERANTKDTIVAWKKTNPVAGEVLVISSQPYAKYQDAAVKSVLPPEYHVETVGAAAPADIKISVALDTLARQIDVAFPKLLEKLESRENKLQAQLVMLDPSTIKVDAATYQFRAGGDANGVTDKGRYQAAKWDPVLHGDPIMVHERLDGQVFVADGHHRVDLARKLNESGGGPGKLAAMVLREADGYTAKDAKIIAAYKNIAHGQTDVVEAARVFKEAHSGQVHMELLPSLQMDKGNLRMAFSMSKLSDPILDSVAKGDVAPVMAAKLAEYVPDDQKRQESVLRVISQKLHQHYDPVAHAQAAAPHINLLPKEPDVKPLPGFVAKLAQERAKTTALGAGGRLV